MRRGSPYGKRLALAAALALCALILTIVQSGTHRGPRPGARAGAQDALERAAAALDSLLRQSGAGEGTARTWIAKAGGAPTGRTEQRITVPRSFRSLEFNHALARRLAPLGMSVVATERSRENTVTMHIVRGGVTIRSVSFVADEH